MRDFVVYLLDGLLAFVELVGGALCDRTVDQQVLVLFGSQEAFRCDALAQHFAPFLLPHQHFKLILQEISTKERNGAQFLQIYKTQLSRFLFPDLSKSIMAGCKASIVHNKLAGVKQQGDK